MAIDVFLRCSSSFSATTCAFPPAVPLGDGGARPLYPAVDGDRTHGSCREHAPVMVGAGNGVSSSHHQTPCSLAAAARPQITLAALECHLVRNAFLCPLWGPGECTERTGTRVNRVQGTEISILACIDLGPTCGGMLIIF